MPPGLKTLDEALPTGPNGTNLLLPDGQWVRSPVGGLYSTQYDTTAGNVKLPKGIPGLSGIFPVITGADTSLFNYIKSTAPSSSAGSSTTSSAFSLGQAPITTYRVTQDDQGNLQYTGVIPNRLSELPVPPAGTINLAIQDTSTNVTVINVPEAVFRLIHGDPVSYSDVSAIGGFLGRTKATNDALYKLNTALSPELSGAGQDTSLLQTVRDAVLNIVRQRAANSKSSTDTVPALVASGTIDGSGNLGPLSSWNDVLGPMPDGQFALSGEPLNISTARKN